MTRKLSCRFLWIEASEGFCCLCQMLSVVHYWMKAASKCFFSSSSLYSLDVFVWRTLHSCTQCSWECQIASCTDSWRKIIFFSYDIHTFLDSLQKVCNKTTKVLLIIASAKNPAKYGIYNGTIFHRKTWRWITLASVKL